MDSFYDQPRQNVFVSNNLDLQIPMVAEVTKASLLVTDQIKDSICIQKPAGRISSYNAWRAQQEKRLQKPQEKHETKPTVKKVASTKRMPSLKESYEQIYMNNIPNRQLDCSLLSPEIANSSATNKENLRPVSYDESDKNDTRHSSKCSDNDTNLNACQLKKILDKLESLNTSQESQSPSMNELYKVIERKDEQIKNLEEQVETLLRINANLLKQQEQQLLLEQQKVANQTEENQKMSVGLMTSFAVNLNNQANKKGATNEVFKKAAKVEYDRPVQKRHVFVDREKHVSSDDESFSNHSQSDDENDHDHDGVNGFTGVHFSLGNSLGSPSEDYQSDSDIKNSDTGMTFYDNIMGQVNQFLENKSNKSSLKKYTNEQVIEPKRNGKPKKSHHRNHNQNGYNDVSAVVKRVLVNYLPQLNNNGDRNTSGSSPNNRNNVIEPSFTTLQYQEKYCLLQSQCNNNNKNKYNNYTQSKSKNRRFK